VGVSPRDKNQKQSLEPRSGDSNRRDSLLSPLRGLEISDLSPLRADARSYLLSPLRGYIAQLQKVPPRKFLPKHTFPRRECRRVRNPPRRA